MTGPREIHVIAVLTLCEVLCIDIAHIHHMLRWKYLLNCEPLMEIPDDLPIRHRGSGGCDLDNQMRSVCLACLGQMHLVSRPGGTFFPAVARFGVVRRSDQQSGRR